MTLTFSEPLDSVTLSVWDPDYSGNQIIAYDAGGQVVSSASIPYDSLPGHLTVEDVSVGGGGIVKLELVPAPLDFVAYGNAFWFGDPQLGVTCSPNPVTRGGMVSCAITGLNATVSEWRYSGFASIAETTSVTPWAGAAVRGGVVTAIGTVDGRPDTGVATLTVTGRSWGSDTSSWNLTNDSAQGLPSTISVLADLGQTWQALLVEPSTISKPLTGPNRGIWYFANPPALAWSSIHINYPAMTPGHPWYDKQKKHGPKTVCKQSDMPAWILAIESHEGWPAMLPLSHARVYHDNIQSGTQQPAESIATAATSSLALDSLFAIATMSKFVTAETIADDSPTGTVPWVQFRSPTDLCNWIIP